MAAQKSGSKANSSAELKICILLPTPFDPDMPARPEVTEIYSEYMPRFGHKITWVTPSRGKGKGIQEKSFKGVKIYSIPRPGASLLPLQILNLFLYLVKEYRLLTAIFKKEKYDIIQVRNDIFGALLALRIRKKYNIPFVFQYSTPVTQGHILGKILDITSVQVMNKANLVLTTSSKRMGSYLVKRGVSKSKIMATSNYVNTNLFLPDVPKRESLNKYSNERQIVIYVGTLDKRRGLDILVRSFARVRGKVPNVILIMVGDGTDKRNLEKLVYDLDIQNHVIFPGKVPYSEVPSFIAAADVAVSPIPPKWYYIISSPLKLIEYMAMAKPVVANEEIPEHKEVLEESGGGICVPFTPEAFAEAIIEVLDNPEKAAEMGRRGREWVVKNRSYEILARQVEERYYQLLRQ